MKSSVAFWNSRESWSHGYRISQGILLSCLKGPACLGTSRKTDKVRYVMVWLVFFCKCVSVCVRSKELVGNEINGTIETEALGGFRCRSLPRHRGPRSWPVHRRRLRTGCARLQLRGSCVWQQLRGHAAGRSIIMSEPTTEEERHETN